MDFTHFSAEGRAAMVDVSGKADTLREAAAEGFVFVSAATMALIKSGGGRKGDVLAVAQLAGIMGAKRASDLVPLCHPLPLTGIDVALSLDEERNAVRIEAAARCKGPTGVEMEALTAVSAAALAVYDMCKAVQKDMTISGIRLLRKSGGVRGDYRAEDADRGRA